MTTPTIVLHPLYSFVSIGKEVDLLEPCPFDDMPIDEGKWLVLVEAPSRSRRCLESFDAEPSLSQAEEFLFSEECAVLVRAWLQEAHDTSNSELAAALRGKLSIARCATPVAGALDQVEAGESPHRFGSPRAHDDVKTRVIYTLGSSLLGRLSELVYPVRKAGMSLERESTSAVIDCLGTGLRWLATLDDFCPFDAAAYVTSMLSVIDTDVAYLESEYFDFARAIPVFRDVREALASEAYMHMAQSAECLRAPKLHGRTKAAFSSVLLRESIGVLTRFVIEQRALTRNRRASR